MDKSRLSENISIDDDKDIVTIHGKRYSGCLFRGLGFKIREDEYFQIIGREDGVITVRVTREMPFDGQASDEGSGD